jgi:hypothetical protein
LFSDCVPIKFEKDVSIVYTLLEQIPKILLKNLDIKQNRDQRLAVKDETEPLGDREATKNTGTVPDIYEPPSQLNLAAKLNMTFKTLEVIGQILKNYHGSLKASTKTAVTEEAYLLGLRSLSPFFEALDKQRDGLIRQIQSNIEKQASLRAEKGRKLNEAKMESLAKRSLFAISTYVSFAFVEQIAVSLGSEHLSQSFKDVREKYTGTSFKLIDIAIKLNFFRAFPFSEIEQLGKDFENNDFAKMLLQMMVVDYLYMYPTDFKTKQRICSVTGITTDAQRIIDASSTQKLR